MLKALERHGVAPLQMVRLRKLIQSRRGDAGAGGLPKPTRPMSAPMQQAAAAVVPKAAVAKVAADAVRQGSCA